MIISQKIYTTIRFEIISRMEFKDNKVFVKIIQLPCNLHVDNSDLDNIKVILTVIPKTNNENI